jgi:hypothetical protein
VLHVTNGDIAAGRISAAGLTGDVLPWRDVLHEGPVPPGADDALRATRADFLGEGPRSRGSVLRGLSERDARLDAASGDDEVVLWFEPDLFDQLQLVQILDRLSRPDLAGVTVSAVETVAEIGALEEPAARALHAGRSPLPFAARELGRRAWACFREPDPRRFEELARDPFPDLPFLAAAIRRHLGELPWSTDGLSRTERQALEAVERVPLPARQAFVAAHHAREDLVYLGDTVFYGILDRLAAGEWPLVRLDSRPANPDSSVAITEDGRAVLEGRADWIALGGSDRWLGGVHLEGSAAAWRWDPAARRVTRSPGSPPDRGSGR